MTLDEHIARLEEFVDNIEEIKNLSINAGLDEFDAQFNNRVFNANEDIEGNLIGSKYSKDYEQLRIRLGKDVSRVNLQFTDKMKRGIKKDYENHALVFGDQEDAQKGEDNERRYRKRIFEASENEAKLSLEVIEETYIELVDGFFN